MVGGVRFGYLPSIGDLLADHRTGTGEQKRVTLADGSVVELNTRTSLSVHFTATQRRLDLIDGEACFSVASDTQRPFIVAAAKGTEVKKKSAKEIEEELRGE